MNDIARKWWFHRPPGGNRQFSFVLTMWKSYYYYYNFFLFEMRKERWVKKKKENFDVCVYLILSRVQDEREKMAWLWWERERVFQCFIEKRNTTSSRATTKSPFSPNPARDDTKKLRRRKNQLSQPASSNKQTYKEYNWNQKHNQHTETERKSIARYILSLRFFLRFCKRK